MVQNVNPYDVYTGPSSAESPGGFVFGPQGWSWGTPIPRTITFFLDGTAKVSDQFGRPIKGSQPVDGRPVFFAQSPPKEDESPEDRKHFASHKQVIDALELERIDWKKLTCAGWPQLPYEELKKLPVLPITPIKELRKIKDKDLRQAALRARRESDEKRRAEIQEQESEE